MKSMCGIFEKFFILAGNFGVVQNAHLYEYGYGTVTVKTLDGELVTFTFDIKGEK